MRPLVFALLVFVATSASVADAYFNLQFPPTSFTEENPLARFILENSCNNVLISLKFCGTLLVSNILWLLYIYRRKIAWAVLAGVLVCEVAIACHMLK